MLTNANIASFMLVLHLLHLLRSVSLTNPFP